MGLRFTNLVSYALLKDKAMLCTHPEWDTMLDSGGFTNFVTGKVHSEIKEYIYFLRTHGHHFWNYFALDKIGNPKVTILVLQVNMPMILKTEYLIGKRNLPIQRFLASESSELLRSFSLYSFTL